MSRILLSIFVCTLLATAVVACQSSETPDDPATASTVTTAPTVAPTEDPPATTAPTADAAAAEQAAPTPELADIMTIIARAEGLEAFAAVAEQVGLAADLSGDGPYTVLLPTTAAFEALPGSVRDDADLMGTIVREHVVAGKYTLDEMANPATVTTLNNDELTLLVGQTGGTIHGSNVLGGDFEAKNGMIHVIDTVILPDAIEAEVLARYEPVAGETLEPMQGNNHIANNEQSPVPYRSTPPTSGPHYPNIAPWQVYDEPWRYEQLLHNLEDAGVVIYYQCPEGCPALLQELRDLVQPYIDGGRHVLVAPNDPSWTAPDGKALHQDMGATIAVAAWRRLLKLDEFDADRITAFIDAFEGIDHHVK
ncbi:MAG: DUF3105 domain-containing protein [Caldilineaceae bacterium]|nr:DUF3105 domain-containing protein [Caldilineaceae bacterium]